jgi:hypothetical protein
MPDEKRDIEQRKENEQPAELTNEELEAQNAADLPDREAMSLVNANLAAPINAAIAANVLSDNSNATADAIQQAPIGQGII